MTPIAVDITGIHDVIGDLTLQIFKVFQEKDEGRKAELVKGLKETHFPHYLALLEKRAQGSGAPVMGRARLHTGVRYFKDSVIGPQILDAILKMTKMY